MKPARWAPALLWGLPALWSSNFIIARLADGVVAPHALAFGRWGLALLVMLPFVGAVLWRERAALREEWLRMLVLGALGMWICGAWVYLGARSTNATNMALIFAASPVAIAVAGVKLLHEPMRTAQRGALGLTLTGVLFIIVRGEPERLLALRFSAGDGWILAATIAWTAYSVLLKRWPSVLPPLARLAAIVAGGLLVLLPFTLAEAVWLAPPPWSARATLLVLLAALLPGVLSYAAYSLLQRELGASRSALALYLAPVYAAGLAWLILGERPGWYHAVGAAMILPGIWLATKR